MATPRAETLEPKMSDYEKTREERIKQNLDRMQKLGILDLSLKLKSVKAIRKNNNFNSKPKTPLSPSLPLPGPEPVRRSSRLQNTGPVSYSELRPEKEDASLKRKVNIYTEGSKPEEYTDEHEKLLGNTEMSWTLFVDGYGKDGKRIYDCVQGKTCHQCRQKTLGHRTHCCKCEMVQGQFCGDCLYMRYGEHVLEAKQNPEWICPVCRGICNCSLCRQAKGWAPTGTLYKKIAQLGFKSVAHYLIQTRRAKADSADNTKVADCSKEPLPIADTEQIIELDMNRKPTAEEVNDMKPTAEEVNDMKPTAEEVNDMKLIVKEDKDRESNTEEVEDMKPATEKVEDMEPTTEEVKESLIPNNDDNLENEARSLEKKQDSSDSEPKINRHDELNTKEEVKSHFIKMENHNDDMAGKTSRISKRKISRQKKGDSVAGRLRQRRRMNN